jgi:hypothetical protein
MTNLPASPPVGGLTVFFRILCFLALILAFCILAGTLYAVYRGPGSGPLIAFGAEKTARPGTERDNGTAPRSGPAFLWSGGGATAFMPPPAACEKMPGKGPPLMLVFAGQV